MTELKITEAVRRNSMNWIMTMQKEYGAEMGMKCFDVMRATFGEDLVGAVMFGLMQGQHGDTLDIRVMDRNKYRKIEAIKAIRALTGLGLKEAKDTVENAEWHNVTILITDKYQALENRHLLDEEIKVLEYAGLRVA